jgi:hypothetical protein
LHVLAENQSSSLKAPASGNQSDPRLFEPDPLVSCTISHVSLDDKPVYTALSYNWGDASLTSPIIVDGSIIAVTKEFGIGSTSLKAT